MITYEWVLYYWDANGDAVGDYLHADKLQDLRMNAPMPQGAVKKEVMLRRWDDNYITWRDMPNVMDACEVDGKLTYPIPYHNETIPKRYLAEFAKLNK